MEKPPRCVFDVQRGEVIDRFDVKLQFQPQRRTNGKKVAIHIVAKDAHAPHTVHIRGTKTAIARGTEPPPGTVVCPNIRFGV